MSPRRLRAFLRMKRGINMWRRTAQEDWVRNRRGFSATRTMNSSTALTRRTSSMQSANSTTSGDVPAFIWKPVRKDSFPRSPECKDLGHFAQSAWGFAFAMPLEMRWRYRDVGQESDQII